MIISMDQELNMIIRKNILERFRNLYKELKIIIFLIHLTLISDMFINKFIIISI